jgi:hypothetical protein
MKVELLKKIGLLKDEYSYLEIVVKKHTKIIPISTLTEKVASLACYLVSDSVEDDSSFIYSKSVLTIHNSGNGIKIYADTKRNIVYKAIECEHRIYSCKNRKTDVNISFIIYYKVKRDSRRK